MNINKILRIGGTAICTMLVLSACSDREDVSAEDVAPIVKFAPATIDATQAGECSKDMRVLSDAQWETGDYVWVYNGSDVKSFYEYDIKEASGVLSYKEGSRPIKWGKDKESFYAIYYKYLGCKPPCSYDIMEWKEEDLRIAQHPILWAGHKDVAKNQWVKFQFAYKVAAVSVFFEFPGVDLRQLKVEVVDVVKKKKMDPTTGKYLQEEGVEYADYEMNRLGSWFSLYVLPYEKPTKIRITYKDKVSTFSFRNAKTEEGKHYSVKLSIDKDGVLREWKPITRGLHGTNLLETLR